MIRSKRWFDKDKSAPLAIGLKLFSEIVLEKTRDYVFAPLVLPLRNFLNRFKSTPAANKAAN